MTTFHSLQVPARSNFPTLTGHLMPEDACRAASNGPHRVAVGAGPAGLRDAARLPNQTADGNTVRRFSSIRRTTFLCSPPLPVAPSPGGGGTLPMNSPVQNSGAPLMVAAVMQHVPAASLFAVGAPPPRSWLALLRMAGPVNAAHPLRLSGVTAGCVRRVGSIDRCRYDCSDGIRFREGEGM
jgi:hypothetical protein